MLFRRHRMHASAVVLWLSLLWFFLGSIRASAQGSPTKSEITGEVHDASGRSIPAAKVTGIDNNRSALCSTLTDSKGKYVLSCPATTPVSLRVQAQGYVPATVGLLTAQQHGGIVIILTSAAKADTQIELYDKPTFTIAGVADASNLGGHGSNATAPTKQELSRDISSLAAKASAPDIDLARERRQLQDSLTREPSNAGLHHDLAALDERLADPLDAAREYQKAAELDPSERNLFDWGADLLLHRATMPAIQVFTRGHRLFPNSERMLLGLGAGYYVANSVPQAWQTIAAAAELSGDDSEPYRVLDKLVESETSVPKDAVIRLERFEQKHPEDANANYYYAVALRKQEGGAGSSVEIEKLLNRAISLNPALVNAYLELGKLYAAGDKTELALNAYQQAEGIDRNNPDVHYQLMQLYRRAGDQSRAVQELNEYRRTSEQQQTQRNRSQSEIPQLIYVLTGSAASSANKPARSR